MIRFGYLYYYSVTEEKGIIIGYDSQIKVFSKDVCDFEIKSDIFVSYNDDDSKFVHSVSQLSLCNFDRDLVCYIASYYETIGWNKCIDKTHIVFYCLDPLSQFYENEPLTVALQNILTDKHQIQEYFDNLYMNYDYKDLEVIDILDMNHWIDKDLVQNSKCYFGEKLSEILDLYEIFIGKKLKALFSSVNFEEFDIKQLIDKIKVSEKWAILLYFRSEEELRTIVKEAPLLQSIVPEDFCKKHKDLLSPNYKVLDLMIIELFFNEKISSIISIVDYDKVYIEIKKIADGKADKSLYDYDLDSLIGTLKTLLEDKFYSIVVPRIESQWKSLSFDINIFHKILEKDTEYIYQISFILDYITEEIQPSSNSIQHLVNLYNNLTAEDQSYLYHFVKDEINMIITNNLIQNYYSLYNIFKEYTDWIKKDTIDNVKMSINSNLLSIEDIYSINNLFEISLLDEEQYLSWIVSVTENYSYQELFHLFVKELPIFVQTYLIERVINIAENLSNSQSASYARKKDDLQYMSFGFNNLLLNNSDLELNNHDAFVNAEIYINNKLQELERNTPEREIKEYWESRVTDYCDYGLEYDQEYSGYGRYEGSYAQDEMGYSDDDIDTIFDGDPDAYWNID